MRNFASNILSEMNTTTVPIGESSSYRFVGGCWRYLLQRGSRDEVSISARRDYAGAANSPRRCISGEKRAKGARRRLRPWPIRIFVGESESLGQDNRIRERKPRRLASLRGCATARIRMRIPDEGAWGRNSHSWPYSALRQHPLSNAFETSQPPSHVTALPYLHSRDALSIVILNR